MLVFLRRRIEGLWVPYVKWGIISILLHNIFLNIGIYSVDIDGNPVESWYFNDIIKRIIGCLIFGTGPDGFLGGYWFLKDMLFAVMIAFIINYACYFSVIFRGGIESVPAGQREAGQVLGMTKTQIFFKINLLQMIKRVVPPMSNEIITLVKDTSLARIIAAYELTFAGYSFMKSDGITWPLFYTGVFYLLFVGILTLLFNYIERKLDYFK